MALVGSGTGGATGTATGGTGGGATAAPEEVVTGRLSLAMDFEEDPEARPRIRLKSDGPTVSELKWPLESQGMTISLFPAPSQRITGGEWPQGSEVYEAEQIALYNEFLRRSRAQLIQAGYENQGIEPGQLGVHSDNGPIMRAKSVLSLHAQLGIIKSNSRPHVSNDNPLSVW